jgi:hypothetical protein
MNEGQSYITNSTHIHTTKHTHTHTLIGRACSAYGEGRGLYRVLVETFERKRPLRRPRGRWEDNIKMDLQEVVCGDMNWIELAQD